jgi:hypothetical protein
MDDSLLMGIGRHTVPVPRAIWQRHVGEPADLGFMSDVHHRVRNWVVAELPRAGEPLAPERIARALDLPGDRVVEILEDLERHMTFLFRDAAGAVAWAYPVTVDETPHRMIFGTGERVNAA